MVEEVNIHFEGASDLRPGFRTLLDRHARRARQRRLKFNLIDGGSRVETVKDFLYSCLNRPGGINVLLIDSEDAVSATSDTIRTLRREGYWNENVRCSDAQIHFMVQAMEAWFVADPIALTTHFGRRFNTNALPSPQNAETVSPQQLKSAIENGLRPLGRRRSYGVSDGASLLGLIDEAAVGQHCPHFKRLMDFLGGAF